VRWLRINPLSACSSSGEGRYAGPPLLNPISPLPLPLPLPLLKLWLILTSDAFKLLLLAPLYSSS